MVNKSDSQQSLRLSACT